MLFLDRDARWHITTFEDPDFDPGFPTELRGNSEHVLEIAIFSDNATTTTCSLVCRTDGEARGPQLSLRHT